ncbi:tubulin-like doman-containing protein [Actinoplanes sp. DH11]|uniref:tubulin-like doman-containing protein n=1 Tax=Actinoplanes sp. DH11 TaxID=2857011 RepID=UPI001E5526A7|nr:tubulin-like doman-containing protein [Actinoplanes sp. DH11]
MLPALVIGLGGTGSAAAAHLKARLTTEQRWQDLMHDPAAPARTDGRPYDWPILLRALDVDRRNRPRVDGVSLDANVEDLYLNGSIGGMIDKIRQGRETAEAFYPTVVPWFSPEDARRIRDDEALSFLVEGAGQIRSFGRLSFFADVLGSTPVTKRLEDALDQLTRVHADTTPNIYVISSTAGGTGAGILLDVLAALQRIRQAHGGDFSVTLFCVLSGAFRRRLDGPQRQRSEANGYALLRELDRLMNVGREHPAEFRWSPRDVHEMTAAPVQYTYFLDGRRSRSAARHLEGFGPETVTPVAIADAVYAHLLPTVGAAFSSYRVNARQYRQGATDLYSTFGVYLVEYAWEPVIRGLVSKAALTVLRGLPDRPGSLAADVDQFLLGEVDIPDAGGALPPPVLPELDSEPARDGLLSPTVSWLQSRDGRLPFPEPPNLMLPFEDITSFRTDHRGQVVIERTQETVRMFWGERGVPVTLKTREQWHPVAEHHERHTAQDWAVALRGAVARIMSRRDGGPRTGLAFLDLVGQRLELFRARVENAPRQDAALAKAARDNAEELAREDKGWRRGKHQLNYLSAEYALLLAHVQADSHARTLRMLDRLAQEVDAVRAETELWRVTVDDAARALAQSVEDVRRERRDAEKFPLRHVLPQVDDAAAEQWLYDRSVTSLDPVAEALAWRVETGTGRPSLVLADARRAAPVDQVVGALADRARPIFAPLRQLSIFELLERTRRSAEEIGKQLITGAEWLVDYNDEEHRRLRDLSPEDDGDQQQQVYAFAALPAADSPGATLSAELWEYLGQQRVELNNIVPSAESPDRPVTDKIMLFKSRHSLRLGAFDGFTDLRQSYEQRRAAPPSPHVIAEEKNAALLEAKSEDLVGEGVLSRPLPRLTGDHLLLCRDFDLLTAAAVALSNERLAPMFAPGETEQVLGWQTRSHRSRPNQELGDEPRLGRLLKNLTTAGTKLAEVRRGAVLAAAEDAVRDLDWEYGTRRFYGLPPAYRLDDDLWRLLTVAAHVHIDKQK